jgi:hypothetical protein
MDALPQAGQAEAGAGRGEAVGRRGRGGGVEDAQPDLRLVVADPDDHVRARRVLPHVPQRPARYPVDRPPDHGGGERGVALLDELGGSADGRRFADQLGQARDRQGLVILGRRPQNADQVTQLIQGLDIRGTEFLRRLPGGLVGRGDAERPRLQHHQAYPVRHDVVPPTAQLVLFPLLFLSGTYLPIHSQVLNQVTGWLPIRPFNEALTGPLSRHAGADWRHLAVLAAWGVIGAIVAVRRFRWDPRPE